MNLDCHQTAKSNLMTLNVVIEISAIFFPIKFEFDKEARFVCRRLWARL